MDKLLDIVEEALDSLLEEKMCQVEWPDSISDLEDRATTDSAIHTILLILSQYRDVMKQDGTDKMFSTVADRIDALIVKANQ